MRQHAKPIFLAAMIVIMLVSAALAPLTEWLTLGITWTETHSTMAWFVYVAIYIIATVLAFPVSILTLAAGFVFGLPLALVLASVGSVLGASAAFLVGRFFVREWVAKRIAGMPRFQALDHATRQEGFMIVFLVRLSPLFPFNVINYGLALTSVRFRHYFLASWLGMLPGTLLYAYFGSVAKDLTALTSGGLPGDVVGRALLFIGLAATVLLTIVVTRNATRRLSQHLARESAEHEGVP